MNKKDITYYKVKLEEEIFSQYDLFDNLIKLLGEMKEAGINQQSAYTILEEIRLLSKVQQNEKFENMVLDLMDIVSRHCPPDRYIW